MSNLAEFWSLSADQQHKLIQQAMPPPPLYRGKYPHLFGCKGKEGDSGKCWEQQHGFRPGDCSCPCHTDCGGEW